MSQHKPGDGFISLSSVAVTDDGERMAYGLAALFPPINTAAFAFVAKEKTNNATSFINLARNIGGSTGIAMATTMLARRQQFHQQALVSQLTPLDPAYRSIIEQLTQTFIARGSSAAHALEQANAAVDGML